MWSLIKFPGVEDSLFASYADPEVILEENSMHVMFVITYYILDSNLAL